MQEEKINRYLKEIINTMNDGLMVASPDGTILMVNQAFEKIMGYRREEIIGRPCTILKCDICSTARSEGKGQWCDLFEQGAATRKRCLFMRKDGSYVPYPQKCRHPAGRSRAGPGRGGNPHRHLGTGPAGMNRSSSSPSSWILPATFTVWWANPPACSKSLTSPKRPPKARPR